MKFQRISTAFILVLTEAYWEKIKTHKNYLITILFVYECIGIFFYFFYLDWIFHSTRSEKEMGNTPLAKKSAWFAQTGCMFCFWMMFVFPWFMSTNYHALLCKSKTAAVSKSKFERNWCHLFTIITIFPGLKMKFYEKKMKKNSTFKVEMFFH